MKKIIALTHLTLDGIMQAPGGPQEDPSGGFTHGGWAMRSDPMMGEVLDQLMAGPFDLLLGRRTYDIWAAYWPHHRDNAIGNAFNRATKYVVTHRPDTLAWATSQRIGGSGDIAAELRALKNSAGPDLHVWGSSEVLQTLIAADARRVWAARSKPLLREEAVTAAGPPAPRAAAAGDAFEFGIAELVGFELGAEGGKDVALRAGLFDELRFAAFVGGDGEAADAFEGFIGVGDRLLAKRAVLGRAAQHFAHGFDVFVGGPVSGGFHDFPGFE